MWISHFFFGCAESNNDINIINRSALIHHHGLKHDLYDSFAYVAGEKEFHQLYYLVDGIYPSYACFMATIFRPSSQKGKLYAKRQESIRKDVERTFGVLRGKFRILKLPSRIWYGEEMLDVMKACVIIHNMIIEDKWGVPGLEELTPANIDADLSPPSGVDDDGVNGDDATDLQEFITRRFNMQSAAANSELRNALIENLWELGEHERIYVSSASTCLRQLGSNTCSRVGGDCGVLTGSIRVFGNNGSGRVSPVAECFLALLRSRQYIFSLVFSIIHFAKSAGRLKWFQEHLQHPFGGSLFSDAKSPSPHGAENERWRCTCVPSTEAAPCLVIATLRITTLQHAGTRCTPLCTRTTPREELKSRVKRSLPSGLVPPPAALPTAQDDDGDDDKEEKRDGCRADHVEINEAESSSAPSEDRTHPRLAPPPPALPTAQDVRR
ncbi:hypothetical protein PF001_g2036 [Phytophthora fragariae]|uniref:DDE Tnp4 domain-containing protein n=1 Tax=Phytophthora fragariae TaxID=53985 RepID=A0A6A4EP12_9STRA|nr:hypothetical protein PF001_g2036 [Phytophthora fragariae]